MRKCRDELLSKLSSMDPGTLLEFSRLISQERQELEPQNHQEAQAYVKKVLLGMESLAKKGDYVKVMRWFSWFANAESYSGELWATKLLIQSDPDPEEVEEQLVVPLSSTGSSSDAGLVRTLKIQQGGWKLAPKLINVQFLSQAESMQACGLFGSISPFCVSPEFFSPVVWFSEKPRPR